MQQYIECKNGKYTIRGMVYVPAGASAEHKVPLVVICHGFTADRNETLFIHTRLARILCAEGIAAISFDFMGSGESDGEFEQMSVLTEKEDALAVLDFVRSLEYVDQSRVALHGMSQGGLVSCLVAAAVPDRVCALSLWAPALCIPDMALTGEMLGVSMEHIEENGYVDFKGAKLGLIYVEDAKKVDVWKEIKKYAGPVQVVHGTSDTAVDFSYSVRLKDTLGDQCTLIPVEGADHDFETLSYNGQRLEHAVAFLKGHLLQ